MTEPVVTIAVPSFNQARYLDEALSSIFIQEIPVEVFVVDGGSTDNSIDIIKKWQHRLSGWRSHVDDGQASAINEAIAQGRAPFVCWLNSDDWLLPGGLGKLVRALEADTRYPAVYGKAWNFVQETGRKYPVWVEQFNGSRLALRCFISQPATVIRRTAWNSVNGVDGGLHMAMDYDLWWRLYKEFGPLLYMDDYVAVNREHAETKTRRKRRLHYKEAMSVVCRHHGAVPFKWWLAQPYAVWFKSLFG